MTRRNIELMLLLIASPIVIVLFAMMVVTGGQELSFNTLGVPLGIFAAFLVAHIAVRLLAPAADPAILPISFALSGVGIAFVTRIVHDLAVNQLLWLFIGIAAMIATLAVVRNLDKLANYKYTLMIVGILLLLSPMLPVIGYESGGGQLWLRFGSFSFQPGELAKILIVFFIAAYLAANREMLSVFTWKVGPLWLPSLATLLPLIVMWALAFIVVVLVVMAFLGRWRATLIICMTIPVSLICSFIYLFATGSTLNIISLSSLSIAIGMVVDDAIVVLENITTHIERGSNPKEAAIYATNEVWLSVIATTLVVVAVFLPLTMVPGMAGILFRELGWIVTIVVCVSTTAAISLTPMMSAYLLKLEGGVHDYKGLGVIYKPIDRALAWLDDAYARSLNWVVRHRRITIFSMMGLFLVSLGLVTQVPTEFFPPSDNGWISATVKLEQNLSVDYTARIARQIDSIIYKNYPEVTLVSASSGAHSSDDAFAAMQTTGSHIINYNVRLTGSDKRERSIYVISDLLRKELDRIPEVREYSVMPGGDNGSMSGSATVDIKVFGYDMDVTNAVANDLKEKLGGLEGTRDVQLSRDDLRPELNVVFDRDRLAYYGMNSATASQAVRNRIDGLVASKYREDGDEYDIVVRYAEPFRMSLGDVENITLYNGQGRPVKLKEVGRVQEEYAAPMIERENRQRVITVKSSLGAGVALGDVVAEVDQLIAGYPVPDGVDLEIGGTVEDQGDAFSDLGVLFILIVILVYIVMATQFESLLFPFIIMFTIPFAATGVFLALWMTSTPMSLIALIGAIMLVGIVTKNGIVMVDYMNLLVERGSGVFDAVIAGGKSRLRPVLMTSFTTILGMLPLAIGTGVGSETWQPMGIAVIGGLTFSTLLTLFIIPALYSVFVNRSQRKEKEKLARLAAAHQASSH